MYEIKVGITILVDQTWMFPVLSRRLGLARREEDKLQDSHRLQIYDFAQLRFACAPGTCEAESPEAHAVRCFAELVGGDIVPKAGSQLIGV